MWLPPCLPGSGTCFPENSVVSGVSEGHVLQSRATHLPARVLAWDSAWAPPALSLQRT